MLPYHCFNSVPECWTNQEIRQSSKAIWNECILVGQQANVGHCGSYLKRLGLQKLKLGMRQTSYHFTASHTVGQTSLLHGQCLWLEILRHEGMGRNKRAKSY